MKSSGLRKQSTVGWLLVIPVLAWFYIGLFITMAIWYPVGISTHLWASHLLHFSIVYVLWLAVFFSYRLFDWDALRSTQAFFGRLLVTLTICLFLAAVYFYFQPALLITPRRFLIVHMIITSSGIVLWYLLMRQAAKRSPSRPVYLHQSIVDVDEAQRLLSDYHMRGLQFKSVVSSLESDQFSVGGIIVMPTRAEITSELAQDLFALRSQNIYFIEYPELYEDLSRAVHLSGLSDLWFLHSIDYRSHVLFDFVKRLIDVFFALIALVIFIVTFPVIAILIKLTSQGPVLFRQPRVGQGGKVFIVYKYRTMRNDSVSNTWTQQGDKRITTFGRFLRLTRLDELPQAWNILIGDMSIVGPRPEQVHIVEQLCEQIPYYNERHIVKPGLTGWAQLHVYAGSLEETKRKLQYDLYYIKHRSLLFDIEIILKTVYNVITFGGR